MSEFEKSKEIAENWWQYRDQVIDDSNKTPVISRRSRYQACHAELQSEYQESLCLAKQARRQLGETEDYDRGLWNGAINDLTYVLNILKSRSKQIQFQSFLDLTYVGQLDPTERELQVVKMQQTMSNERIARIFNVSEAAIRQTSQSAYRRLRKYDDYRENVIFWFFTPNQIEIAKCKLMEEPLTYQAIAKRMKWDEEDVLIEAEEMIRLCKAIGQIDQLERKVKPELFNQLSVRQRIIYILTENGMKNKDVAKLLCVSETYVSKEKVRVKKKLTQNTTKLPSN